MLLPIVESAESSPCSISNRKTERGGLADVAKISSAVGKWQDACVVG